MVHRLEGAGSLLLSGVFMATNGYFVKVLTPELPVWEVVGLRLALTLPAIVLLARALGKPIASRDMKGEVVFGLIGVIGVFGYFYGIATVGMSVAALLLYTAPFFGTLFSRVMLREKITVRHVIGLAVSFAGIVLIIKPGFAMEPGILVALVGGIFYGLKMVLNRRLGRIDSAWTMTYYFLMVPTVLFIPYAALNPGFVVPSGSQLPLLAGLVLIPSIGGFLLQHHGLRLVRVTEGSVLLMSEAVAAAAIGILLFGESLDFATIAGGILILGSGAYLNSKVED